VHTDIASKDRSKASGVLGRLTHSVPDTEEPDRRRQETLQGGSGTYKLAQRNCRLDLASFFQCTLETRWQAFGAVS